MTLSARTMYESYKANKPVTLPIKSVAAGLSPPYAGKWKHLFFILGVQPTTKMTNLSHFPGPNAFRHCKKHVDDILLVSDQEILQAMFQLQRHGLMVEPSGAAAFAALYFGKVPDVKGKKVVVVITGGNVAPEELVEHKKTLNL